jgi:glycosyltransferase involved in cell wall biosynthesis
MKVSILMPIYNGIEFLQESLPSVRRQTHKDWELLIGINGHADPKPIVEIAESLRNGDDRIRIFVQTTKGKPDSLNDLMQHVTAEWVALLDVDDMWDITKLEEQVSAICPDITVVGTLCRYFGDLSGSPDIPTGYIDPVVLKTLNPIINSSSLTRKRYCYWTNDYDAEDYELWMRICLAGGKLYNIPKILVSHRLHKESAFNWKKQDVEGLRNSYKHSFESRVK